LFKAAAGRMGVSKGLLYDGFFLGRRPAVDYVDYIERKIAIPQKTESAESVPGY